MRKLVYLISLLYLTIPFTSTAQMQVSGVPMTILGGPASYNAMLQQLFGAGVMVSNVTLNCDTTALQAGWFTATGTNLGINQGMFLTSGDINGGPGPNSSTGYTGAVTNRPGDADLNTQVVGFTTYDACIIEFDIVPYCDTLGIKYVFGSEEYEEWVNSSFNDVFAFFITGPNPLGGNYVSQNIAKVPGTATSVSINNVNCNSNNAYYRCNDVGSIGYGGICNGGSCPTSNATTTLEYDGLTTVMDAIAAVVPCQSYHIKIAIADGGDHVLDSGVFLQAGGVGCTGNILNVSVSNTLGAGGNYAVEGCVDGIFTFNLPAPLVVADTFIFDIAGNAVSGVDYQAGYIQDTLIIQAGQSSATFTVPIINDMIPDGGENIMLIYTDSSLCGAQIFVDTFYLWILDPPVVSAGPDKVLCSGDTVAMGVAPSFAHSYHWTPNTGIIMGTDTLPTALVSMTNNTGIPYTMTYLFADSAGLTGCVSYDTVLVVVNPSVTSDFTTTNVCYGATASFNNTSTPNAVTWNWDFGDATSSVLTSPTHFYNASGTYNVQLIVGSQFGCLDTVVHPITIYPKPIADFSTANVCFMDSVSFTDLTNIPINLYAWDFGNTIGFDTAQNPIYLYPSPGNYNVQLITATLDGCLDTVIHPVQVYEPITAGFTVSPVCRENASIFNNTSIVNGGTYTSAWDLGDGSTSTQASPSHIYLNPGTYNVTLIVTTNNGCKDTITQVVTVYPKPVADFTAPPVCFHLTTQFTDNTGTASQWDWKLGDGSTFATQNVSYVYQAPGTYQATLIVTNSDGCKDTITKPVDVYSLPVADFNVANKCIYDNLVFQNLSTQGTNAISTYAWDFGDTQTSSQTAPSHLYGLHGPYTVTLITTDVFGCADTVQKGLEVYARPIPQFNMTDECQDATVTFINGSNVAAGNIVTNYWNFGDGQTTFIVAPTHVYTTPGVFYVELVTTTEHSCIDSITKTMTIFPKPTPAFEVDPVCWGDQSAFLDNSTITPIVQNDVIVAWDWNFGDGNFDVTQNPVHTYVDPGNYSVTLTATTDKGCERSLTQIAVVNLVPIEPTILNDTACFGSDALLFAMTPSGVRVNWFMTPTDTIPFHVGNQYALPNLAYDHQYFVQAEQIVGGCKSSILEIHAQVFSETNQSVQASDTLIYIPNAITSFFVQSSIPLVNYNWDFGDHNSSTSATPVHQYQYPGIYRITVQTIDQNGCDKTLEKFIVVKEVYGIHVPTIFTPNGDLSNDEFFIGANQIATFRIDIYNRWGQAVFSSENPDFRWDGKTANGKDCPEGVYVYKIVAVSSNNKPIDKSGTITLTR